MKAILTALVIGLLTQGCALFSETRKWDSRIGNYCVHDAARELGTPSRTEKLPNGKTTSIWLKGDIHPAYFTNTYYYPHNTKLSWCDEVACFENTRRRTGRDIDTYLFPAQTIWAQDHSEPMMDGNGDVPCYAFAHDRNAFNHAHKDFNPGASQHRANSEVALYEIFRNRGMSGVLWADGHTSKLGIDHVWEPSWYTGGHKGAQQAWEERENGRFTEPPPYTYTYTGRL